MRRRRRSSKTQLPDGTQKLPSGDHPDGKAGIGADAVRDMCHAELSAWFEDILSSLGIKTPKEEGVIVSKRLRKPEGK